MHEVWEAFARRLPGDLKQGKPAPRLGSARADVLPCRIVWWLFFFIGSCRTVSYPDILFFCDI